MRKLIKLIPFAIGIQIASANDYELIEDGYWGSWLDQKNAPAGYYGCGASLRVEGKKGSGDDTAANGLRILYCSSDNWDLQQTMEINEGHWGSWYNT
jgi:hypothetical protein